MRPGAANSTTCLDVEVTGARTTIGLNRSEAHLARARSESPVGIRFATWDTSVLPFPGSQDELVELSAALSELRHLARHRRDHLGADSTRRPTRCQVPKRSRRSPEVVALTVRYDEMVALLDGDGASFTIHHHAPLRSVADALAAGLPVGEAAKTLGVWAGSQVALAVVPALARLDLVALGTVLGHAGVRLCGHQELTRLDGELGALSPFSVDAAAVVVDHDVARSPRVLCGSGRADRDARDLRAGPGSPVRCQRVAHRDASTSAAGRRFVKTGGRSGASTTASKGIATLAGLGRSSGGRRSARGRPAASSALGPAQQGGGEHAQHDRDPRGGV